MVVESARLLGRYSMLRIAVCDDDPIFLEYESKCINTCLKDRNIQFSVSSYSKGEDLLDSLSACDKYDLLFLDVEMPDINGMNLAKIIRMKSNHTHIAFVSAYIDYSLDGYKVNAVRYILKDYDSLHDYIEECIDFVINQMDKDALCLQFDFTIGKRTLPVKDILYLESNRNYVVFVMSTISSEQLKLRKPLKALTKELSSYGFVSLNSNCTVNLSHVKSICRYEAQLYNGKLIRISQKRYNEAFKTYTLNEGKEL